MIAPETHTATGRTSVFNASIRLASLVALLGLGACVNDVRSYRSADGRDVKLCSAAALGIIPALMADAHLGKCRDALLKSGYTEVQ